MRNSLDSGEMFTNLTVEMILELLLSSLIEFYVSTCCNFSLGILGVSLSGCIIPAPLVFAMPFADEGNAVTFV